MLPGEYPECQNESILESNIQKRGLIPQNNRELHDRSLVDRANKTKQPSRQQHQTAREKVNRILSSEHLDVSDFRHSMQHTRHTEMQSRTQ